MTIQESLYLRLLQAGVLSERELERYQNLNELSKNRDVVLDRFSFEFSNDITARIDAFLASEHTQPSPDSPVAVQGTANFRPLHPYDSSYQEFSSKDGVVRISFQEFVSCINKNLVSDYIADFVRQGFSFSSRVHLLEFVCSNAGELAQPSPDSPATDRQGSATNFQDLIPSDFIGRRVKIKANQPHRGGAPKFPNRMGTIISVVPKILETDRQLFDVSLNPTSRSSERTELFFMDDLEFLPDLQAVEVIEQSPSKSSVQTLFDGLYDVASKVKAKVSKLTNSSSNPSPAPVQLTLFELLQPYAIDQYNKMQALLQAYLKDFAELKNPQSRLFKMLGAKSQKRLAELEDKLRILRRDLVFHFLCWELPQRLWVVV